MRKISVIIPCYNYGHFLSEAIDSVLSQTYSNWECIIIDDGSSDNTRTVSEKYIKYDSRIIYIHKENGGLSSARNLGIKTANGDFIQFLDADDLLDSTKFEKQLTEFEANPIITVNYTNFNYLLKNNELAKSHFKRTQLSSNNLLDFILNWGFEFVIPIHCALIRASLLREHKIYFDETLRAREDWFFWIRLVQCGAEFSYFDESLALYRKHEFSMVHNPNYMFTYTLKACLKVYELVPDECRNEFEVKYASYLSDFLISNKVEFDSYQSSLFYKAYRIYNKLKSFTK